MGERQERLRRALDELVDSPGAIGAALVSRDGISVMDAFKRPFHRETFSAMAATLMGASEIALAEIGAGPSRRVIAEAEGFKMIVLGVTQDLLLVVLSETAIPLEGFLNRIEAGAEGIAALASR